MPKAFGSDCISVVGLRNCESEYFKILAKLSQKCLKGFRLLEGQICGPCIEECCGNSTTKHYHCVRCPAMDSNLNNRLVDHRKKRVLVSDFHYGFRFSQSTLHLLTVISDKLATAFDRSRTRYITLLFDISKGFYRVWHTGLLQNSCLTEFQVGYLSLFCLSSVIIGFDWTWIEILRKNIQLMLQFLKGPFLSSPNSCYTLMTFQMIPSEI